MPLDHVGFRWEVIKAVGSLYPDPKPRSFLQAVQVVSLHESSYGQGWKPPGVGSNNTGAVQSPGCDPVNSFEYTDTHPNADGSSTKYHVCFKKYPSLYAGIRDQAKYMFHNPNTYNAAMRGDLWGVAAGMRESGYYEGFGKTQQDRINGYYQALKTKVSIIAKALNEPADLGTPPAPIPGQNPMAGASSKDSGKTIAAMVTVFGLIRLLSK